MRCSLNVPVAVDSFQRSKVLADSHRSANVGLRPGKSTIGTLIECVPRQWRADTRTHGIGYAASVCAPGRRDTHAARDSATSTRARRAANASDTDARNAGTGTTAEAKAAESSESRFDCVVKSEFIAGRIDPNNVLGAHREQLDGVVDLRRVRFDGIAFGREVE